MNININRVKIIVTIPIESVNEVRNAICEAGAGIIGNYTYCSKLEVVCDVNNVKNVILKLREIHPYEEPAIDIIPLLDEENFA